MISVAIVAGIVLGKFLGVWPALISVAIFDIALYLFLDR